MTPLTELDLLLFADYFQFYLQDEGSTPVIIRWTPEELDTLLGVTRGTIVVGTTRNMTVPVKIVVFGAEPAYIVDEQQRISKINECDLTVDSGTVIIAGLTDYQPDAAHLTLQQGIYRVRIYYYSLDELSEDGLEGNDTYTVQLWQTTTAKGTLFIKSDLPAL